MGIFNIKELRKRIKENPEAVGTEFFVVVMAMVVAWILLTRIV